MSSQSMSIVSNSEILQNKDKFEIAYFAGGCFWCVEAAFDKVKGVVDTTSGFMGGHVLNPTYEQVSSGVTGHRESVAVTFDPSIATYDQLLEAFWRTIDPLDGGGQFSDRGFQYTSAIFYSTQAQKESAEKSKGEIEKRLGQSVKTEIIQASPFYKAEEYHQDYHLKHPLKYNFFRSLSGRPQRLKELWGGGE